MYKCPYLLTDWLRVPPEQAMERDKFMNPTEAKDFGILDLVLEHPALPAAETEHAQQAA